MTTPDAPAYSMVIDSEATWLGLAHTPTDRVFSGCEVLKFIVDVRPLISSLPSFELKSECGGALTQALYDEVTTKKPLSKLYYLNSKVFEFHYEFAASHLGVENALATFNDDCYFIWPREFLIGTLVFYRDQNLAAFEVWPGDTMPGEALMLCQQLIETTCPLVDQVSFRIASELHGTTLNTLLANRPQEIANQFVNTRAISSEKLFAGVVFQPLTPGVTYGRLRLVDKVNDPTTQSMKTVQRGDILVTDDIPNDIPPLRGLITCAVQTPLCHVALLCANRKTPNMALKDAWTKLKELDGKLVRLEVTLLEYNAREATVEEESKWLASQKKSRPAIKIVYDNSMRGLITTEDAISGDKKELKLAQKNVGAKAGQVMKMADMGLDDYFQMQPIQMSFSIPFAYYEDHMKSVEPTPIPEDPALQIKALKKLRKSIREQPMDPKLTGKIWRMIEKWRKTGTFDDPVVGGVIFRSSTNVEDLPGFNGAGLYLSEPVTTEKLTKTKIESVVKKVWASLWNATGFLEREEFGIPRKNVGMAVLVMPFYANVHANGVVVTGNPFRQNFDGMFFNTQLGSSRVTDNCHGATAEQILVYNDSPLPVPETISTSSLAGGQTILTTQTILRVWSGLRKLHSGFRRRGGGSKSEAPVVDVEYLLLQKDDTLQLVLLQCRPYTILYHSRKE